jgi:hypothetical protein
MKKVKKNSKKFFEYLQKTIEIINLEEYLQSIFSLMISTVKALKLVKIYCYVCDRYEKDLQYHSERFSNNKYLAFTDQEAITLYLYVMQVEQRFKVKHIYEFASEHLRSWFPKLPSYVAFDKRINRLNEVFRAITGSILTTYAPKDCDRGISLVDSMPIISCSGKRKPKVALEITDKGYCSTKSMYYYGLKLHALAYRNKGHLPHPEQLLLSPASVNDLSHFKQTCYDMENRQFFGDKIYRDANFFANMEKNQHSFMFTPVKAVRGQTQWETQMDRAYNGILSTAVSSIRQPIESLFNWLIEKTEIQKASKVRSTKGLLTFVFGRMAAAFIYLIL